MNIFFLDKIFFLGIIKKPFRDFTLEKSKISKNKMKIHSDSLSPKYFCYICQKSFKAKQSLLDHQMGHSGLKPLKWY